VAGPFKSFSLHLLLYSLLETVNDFGSKSTSLLYDVQTVTGIPTSALSGGDLSTFSHEEKFRWAEGRQTKRSEDRAYSLLGLFGVYIPLIYGEGEQRAFRRLRQAIDEEARYQNLINNSSNRQVPKDDKSLFFPNATQFKDAQGPFGLCQRRRLLAGRQDAGVGV